MYNNIGAQDYYEKGSKGMYMYVFSIIILCTVEPPIKDTIQNLYIGDKFSYPKQWLSYTLTVFSTSKKGTPLY